MIFGVCNSLRWWNFEEFQKMVMFPLKNAGFLGFLQQVLVCKLLSKFNLDTGKPLCNIRYILGQWKINSRIVTDPFATNFQRATCHYQGQQQTWICFPPSKKTGVPPELWEVIVNLDHESKKNSGQNFKHIFETTTYRYDS